MAVLVEQDGRDRGTDGQDTDKAVKRIEGVSEQAVLTNDLTGRIIGACFDVSKELGSGFVESVYESALMVALIKRGIKAQRQVPLKVYYQRVIVGEFLADLLVEDQVVVELKCVDCLLSEHQAQLINYLNATGLDIGLLINFGRPRVQHKRCFRSADHQLEQFIASHKP